STTRGSSETQLNQVGRRTQARVREVGNRFSNHELRAVSGSAPIGDLSMQRRNPAAVASSIGACEFG
ncbi:MAG TPA: hypothetical protein VKO16_11340, partial [Polyangia bacterium]|nr:hypothetical protein [Polyangia bacterium]